ncbi:MAG: stage III sporulation protein AE [Clostridia bacterium]|nr:stage III sporulation protein AE [Clostridia bacterium]
MRRRAAGTCLAAAIALALLLPAAALAQEEDDGAIGEEIERQIGELDLGEWDAYAAGIGGLTGRELLTIDELIADFAERGYSDTPGGLWDSLTLIAKAELKRSAGAVAALAAAALLTALTGLVADDGIRPLLGTILCGAAVTMTASVFASLCGAASDAVASAGRLAESSIPIMSALLISLGSVSAAGMFRPLMLFLSGTVIFLVRNCVLPAALFGGVLCIVDALTDGSKTGEMIKLVQKLTKWALGLVSTFYFGLSAVQGLTVASRDGVTVRTAKYALSGLVPIVGNMLGGTVDSVMGCALLVKNGVGAAAILILLSLLIRPLAVLTAGIFVFRVSAALSQPAADPRVTRLFSGAADMTAQLFACVAVTGAMTALTFLVFIASGGISAGLW